MEMAVDVANYFSGWGAAFFIIGVVFSSTMAEHAVVGSLMDFLRNVRHEKLPHAATTLNMQVGVTDLLAVAGAFLTDAYLGHYPMVLFSTAVYIAGLGLFTLAASRVPTKGAEEGLVFYTALILISMGQGGHDPSLKALGSDQIRAHNNKEEKVIKGSTKAWWYTGVFLGMGVGLVLAFPVHDETNWVTAGVVSTSVMLVAWGVFVGGTPCYIFVKPCGSLLTRVVRVLVAAVLKRDADFPVDGGQLYEKPEPLDGEQLLRRTDGLR